MVWYAHPIKLGSYTCVLFLSLIAIISVGGCAGGSSSTPPPPVNATPAIASLTPPTVDAGSIGATITINGTGFIASSVAQWNHNSRTTTFVNGTQLQVALTAADLASGGTGQITVTNPAPGGGASGALALTVNNPMPAVTGISPGSITTLAAGAVLTLNGSGFVTASVVMWNGATHSSTFVSPTQLQITLTTADVATAGSSQIVVVNPAPGGGSAAPAAEPILNPVPAISSLNPSSVASGGQAQTLTVNGSGFVSSSVVQLDGVAHPTSFVSGSVLTSTLSAADIATSKTYQVTVATAAPGGGASAAATLTVNSYPKPTIASLTPTSIPIGSLVTLIDVLGTGFTPDSTAQVNGGSSVSITGLSVGELLFTLPAADDGHFADFANTR
jgi:trimeric autotransporter adhesin